jgi:hypothetical protein
MLPEVIRRLQERGELDAFFDLFSHRARYYDVLSPREVGAATGRMLLSGRTSRARLVREAVTLLASEPRRRWINRHPHLAPLELTAAPRDRSREAPDEHDGNSAHGLVAERSG